MENIEDSEELSMIFRMHGCRIMDKAGKLLLKADLSGGFLSKKLDFYDADGAPVAKVRQIGLGKYRLDCGGQTMELHRRFTLTDEEYVMTGWVLHRTCLSMSTK